MVEQLRIQIAEMIDKRMATVLGQLTTRLLATPSVNRVELARLTADLAVSLALGEIEWKK